MRPRPQSFDSENWLSLQHKRSLFLSICLCDSLPAAASSFAHLCLVGYTPTLQLSCASPQLLFWGWIFVASLLVKKPTNFQCCWSYVFNVFTMVESWHFQSLNIRSRLMTACSLGCFARSPWNWTVGETDTPSILTKPTAHRFKLLIVANRVFLFVWERILVVW